MNPGLCLLSGIGIGAGLMYFLDPILGRRRRAQMRNQAVGLLNQTDDALGVIGRDLSHRATGWVAEARSLMGHGEASDRVLVERVHTKLGRYVSHPHAIEVTARAGQVTLSGPILAREVDGLMACARSVAGVRGVDNQLSAHEHGGALPSLQGGKERRGERFELMQDQWAPATRALVGAAGTGLLACGVARGFPVGCVLGTAGLGLLARAVTNQPFARMCGLASGRGGIHVQKVIHVAAPVDRVFEFWARYENFPRFMAHVRDVRPELGTNRSHWVVAGPAGIPVEFDTVITCFQPNECLEWETVPGSLVAHRGCVRFQPAGAANTRIDVHMSYHPPGGPLGHAVASLFGADPRHALDDDLMRFKSLIEFGKTTAHGEQVTRTDLAGANWERGLPAATRGH